MKRSMMFILSVLAMILGQSGAWAGDWFPIGPQGAPAAREGHSMVTLPDGRILLFGGEDAQGTLFNDLYAFENNGWAKITPHNSPPTPRYNHQAWVRGDAMYIWGGQGQTGPLNDLWNYNSTTNTWQQVPTTGPGPVARQGQSTTTLADGSVIIVGGTDTNGNPLKDAWRLNTNNTYTRLTDAPYAFNEASAELVVNNDWMLVFGKPGSIGIYRVSSNDWTLVSGGPPNNGPGCSTSRGTNAAGDPVIFIFGGKDANGNETSDVYEYDVYSGELTQRESMPQPMVNGASAQIPATPPAAPLAFMQAVQPNALQPNNSPPYLVFGGFSGGVTTNNTYLFTPGNSDLSVTKSAAPDPVQVGGNLTYTITVTNLGPTDPATGVTLTDALPAGTAFVSATPTQGDCAPTNATTVTCNLGNVVMASPVTVTIVVKPLQTGQITNTATVTGNVTDPSSANNTAQAVTTVNAPSTATADLAITKTAAPEPVQMGNNLTYTVTVTNNGPTDPATGVILTDSLPAGVTFVSATPGQGTCNQAGVTVSCNLGNIAMATPVVTTIVATPAQAGQITNTATVAGNEIDNSPANNTAQAITTVNAAPAPPPPPPPPPPASDPAQGADLSLRKLASVNPVAGGSLLVYTLNIENRGPLTAKDVVNDSLPKGLNFILAAPSQGTCTGTVNILCHLGTLANGDTASVLLAVRTQSTPGTLINFASVGAATHDPNSNNNRSGVISNVIPGAPGAASLTLNANAFRTGDSLSLTAAVDPGSSAIAADIYFGLQLPDGAMFFKQSDGSASTVVAPMLSNSPLSAVAGNLFSYIFTGPEPAGQYEWFLIAFRAGTADLIGQVYAAPFSFTP